MSGRVAGRGGVRCEAVVGRMTHMVAQVVAGVTPSDDLLGAAVPVDPAALSRALSRVVDLGRTALTGRVAVVPDGWGPLPWWRSRRGEVGLYALCPVGFDESAGVEVYALPGRVELEDLELDPGQAEDLAALLVQAAALVRARAGSAVA